MQELTKDVAFAIHKDVVHAIEAINTFMFNVQKHEQHLPIPHWTPIMDTLQQLKKLYAVSYAYIVEAVASMETPKEDNYEEVLREIMNAVKTKLVEADRTNQVGELTVKIILAPKGVNESIH